MKKTLLLCFIHGFKGGDDTFGQFPEHLRALLSNALPKIEVKAIVYPKFETRGDLAECVGRFREWLLEKVIDIEVSACTPSPTIDPSVHTILVGHSMGGIVAADTVLSLAHDLSISNSRPTSSEAPPQSDLSSTSADPRITETPKEKEKAFNNLMFPYISGVLAFDTPYLGISPGVVAHGATDHYNTASSAYSQLSSLSTAIWGAKEVEKAVDKKPVAALPAPGGNASVPGWQKWGKMALMAGAGVAVAGGGVAAYRNRETLTSGYTWATSHLEFVGCLMKGQELQNRVNQMVELNQELGTGHANIYTRLGKRALSKNDGETLVGSVIGNQRTFCNLPKQKGKLKNFWHEAINDAAGDEAGAHMTMFYPKDNPGYYAMSEAAKTMVTQWTTNGATQDWYDSASGYQKVLEFENEIELE